MSSILSLSNVCDFHFHLERWTMRRPVIEIELFCVVCWATAHILVSRRKITSYNFGYLLEQINQNDRKEIKSVLYSSGWEISRSYALRFDTTLYEGDSSLLVHSIYICFLSTTNLKSHHCINAISMGALCNFSVILLSVPLCIPASLHKLCSQYKIYLHTERYVCMYPFVCGFLVRVTRLSGWFGVALIRL